MSARLSQGLEVTLCSDWRYVWARRENVARGEEAPNREGAEQIPVLLCGVDLSVFDSDADCWHVPIRPRENNFVFSLCCVDPYLPQPDLNWVGHLKRSQVHQTLPLAPCRALCFMDF